MSAKCQKRTSLTSDPHLSAVAAKLTHVGIDQAGARRCPLGGHHHAASWWALYRRVLAVSALRIRQANTRVLVTLISNLKAISAVPIPWTSRS
jgi:hypothetical protein